MIRQTVLPFKIEKTKDTITAHGGLALFGEFVVGTGILGAIDEHLPKPGSSVSYKPSEYIFPIVLMLNGGGRKLEDIRVIRQDEGLREILPLGRLPSSDAIGDWLRSKGVDGGLDLLEKVEQILIKQGIKKEEIAGYTLDIDATGIEAEKESAKMTYKGYKGYMPIVGYLAENGLIIGEEFREGNVPACARNLEFIKHCIAQMPEVSPSLFEPGNSIQLSMGVNNKGELAFTGQAMIRITHLSRSSVVKEFQEEVTLDIDQSIPLSFNWDTTGNEAGRYYIVGYLLYDGRTSNVCSHTISTYEDIQINIKTGKDVYDYFENIGVSVSLTDSEGHSLCTSAMGINPAASVSGKIIRPNGSEFSIDYTYYDKIDIFGGWFYVVPAYPQGIYKIEVTAQREGYRTTTKKTAIYIGDYNQGDCDGDGDNNLVDTDDDNDGLSDIFEQEKTETLIFMSDTDGNGIPDGSEDPDGDGFTNLKEYLKGTDPLDSTSYFPYNVQLCDSLIAYYCFDDLNNIGKDCSDNGHNGAPHGDVSFGEGIIGHSASFDNITETRITLPDHDSLDTDYSFTISAWIYPTGYRAKDSGYHVIASKWYSSPSIGDYILALFPEGMTEDFGYSFQTQKMDINTMYWMYPLNLIFL